MKEKLGVILVEDAEGLVSVQLFEKPDSAEESFDNLVKLDGNKGGRGTFIRLDYKGNKIYAKAKNLPVEEISRDEQPDGIVLGEGPLWLDKKEKTDEGS